MTTERSIPNPDELRQQMAEAAVLPPDDPRRLAVMRDIVASRDAVLHEEWITLIASDEQMRLDLIDVEVPAGLLDRLRQVPDAAEAEAPIRHVRFARPRWSVAVSIAAMIAVAGLVWLTNLQQPIDSEFDLRLKTLALLALDHSNTITPVTPTAATNTAGKGTLAVATTDKPITANLSADSFGFKPEAPQLPPHMKFVNAAKAFIGGHPVVAFHILDEGQPRTIYQFKPDDYNLPHSFTARTIQPPGPWYNHQKGEVTFWTDKSKAYAIVNPGGDDDLPSTSGL
jgi:hypothetical protein